MSSPQCLAIKPSHSLCGVFLIPPHSGRDINTTYLFFQIEINSFFLLLCIVNQIFCNLLSVAEQQQRKKVQKIDTLLVWTEFDK